MSSRVLPRSRARPAYRERVSILLWLVPPLVVTVLACLWVGWLGREQTATVDREQAAARMGAALERAKTREARRKPPPASPRGAGERSSGIAVRPSRPSIAGESPAAFEEGHRREVVPRPAPPDADPTALPAWLDEEPEGPRRTA